MLANEKAKKRFLAVFIPIVLIGLFYSVSTRNNVGPTHTQLALMKSEIRWITTGNGGDIVIYAKGEVSKSGLADLYEIIEPTYWQQPSIKTLEAHGWVFYSEGAYCKHGVRLVFSPSSHKDKNAISIRMTYDEKSVKECRQLEAY